MNLNELAQALRSVSDEKLLDDLAHDIEAWKADDRAVNDLETMGERFFGNTWMPGEEAHSRAYACWKVFRDNAIRGIAGMTMNERLYLFSLFVRFDSCETEVDRRVVYGKLLATP